MFVRLSSRRHFADTAPAADINRQTDMMPIEYAALMREMCVAFRLLEDFGGLKPGDSVILNAVRHHTALRFPDRLAAQRHFRAASFARLLELAAVVAAE